MKRILSRNFYLPLRSIAKLRNNVTNTNIFQAVATLFSLPYLIWQLVIPVIPLGKMADRISDVSRFILEKNKTRHIIGFNLASILLLSSLIPFTQIQADVYPHAQELVIESPEMRINTEETFQMPVPGYISQHYGWLHHGIDIAGNNGASVFPITNGVVKEISYTPFGYGLQIVLDHGNGIVSRYAHLQSVNVELNQKLSKKDILGFVGSTGWSTGPHLHLEIYQNSRSVNPFAYVPKLYSTDIKVIAAAQTKISREHAISINKISSISANVEFKQIATGFTDPNWYTASTSGTITSE